MTNVDKYLEITQFIYNRAYNVFDTFHITGLLIWHLLNTLTNHFVFDKQALCMHSYNNQRCHLLCSSSHPDILRKDKKNVLQQQPRMYYR